MTHQAVLLQEAIESLAIKDTGIYCDCTFGRGGHSQLILQQLSKTGKLMAIDKDWEAINYAKKHLGTDSRLQLFQGSFAKLDEFAKTAGVYGQIDGILLDLGVSSPQLDNKERGFSFMQTGPLDMRMDATQSMDAAYFINNASLEEMSQVFRDYGEERFARRIAKAIVSAREKAPILNTVELAQVVKAANPKWEKHKHPATRVFQAIRIHINQELSDLQSCLHKALAALKVGGRLAVISFHSLEDRIVKQFMKTQEEGISPPLGVPIRACDIISHFKRIGKAIKPQDNEIKENIRSRSAILRVGEKTA